MVSSWWRRFYVCYDLVLRQVPRHVEEATYGEVEWNEWKDIQISTCSARHMTRQTLKVWLYQEHSRCGCSYQHLCACVQWLYELTCDYDGGRRELILDDTMPGIFV